MVPFCSLSVLFGCAGAHTALRRRAASFSRISSHMRSPPWHPPAPAPRRLHTAKRASIASARARRQAKLNRTKFKINPRRERPQLILYKPMSNSQTLHEYHCLKRWHNQHVRLINEHETLLTLQKLMSQRPLKHDTRGSYRFWAKLYWRYFQFVMLQTVTFQLMTLNDLRKMDVGVVWIGYVKLRDVSFGRRVGTDCLFPARTSTWAPGRQRPPTDQWARSDTWAFALYVTLIIMPTIWWLHK